MKNETAENINFDNLIKEFADRETRTVKFYYSFIMWLFLLINGYFIMAFGVFS